MNIQNINNASKTGYAHATMHDKEKNNVKEAAKHGHNKEIPDGFKPAQKFEEAKKVIAYSPKQIQAENLSKLWESMFGFSRENISLQFGKADALRKPYEDLDAALKNVGTTPEAAAAAISENGDWGVNAVATRLMNMAAALSGGDVKFAEELRAAVQKGFEAVGSIDSLPQVCQDTYTETMARFDKWIETGVIE